MNQPGKSLGVVGLGGLGHMAIKFGKAFGLRVTVFSTSISKKEEALSLLGADNFVVSSNQEEMRVSITWTILDGINGPYLYRGIFFKRNASIGTNLNQYSLGTHT
jgi:D-arabinose 1-dehydrogenase-like Zn-dependent alcohol dehydrogenase